MKSFYQQNNIGKAKYTISYHDGISTHKDGSAFFGIRLFKSKRELKKCINSLLKEGYISTN